ncbi:MAG: hypothetical protein KDC92_01120 [Bacteroidetes bacterium]|nr:hypothetical protein [Bacteroidota bacterium]
MARKSSEEVFELIKSLAISEKRYFKIFASLHTVGDKNKYLTLFDLIEQQETYDEPALILAMNEQGGVTFSKLKKYLYDLILKALRNYNADKNGVYELTSAINDVNILFSKGLYAHANKMLQKAEKVAQQYELFSYNYLIENWKRRLQLHVTKGGIKQPANTLSDRIEEYARLDYYLSAFAQFKKFKENTSVIQSVQELPKDVQDIFNSECKSDSQKLTFFHNRIKCIVYRLNLDNEAYLEQARGVYELANNHPSLPTEDVLTYSLEPLLEFSNALLRNQQFGEFSKMIRKVTPYITASKMQLSSKGKADIEAKINLMKSEYDRLNGKMANSQEHIETIIAIEESQHLQPTNAMRNMYYWELINWYFLEKEYELALGALEKLQRTVPVAETSSAIICANWILLYQLKQTEALAKSVEEHRALSVLETAVKKTMQAELKGNSINNMITLKKTLKQLQTGPEKVHFKFFNFLDWVNNRMLSDESFSFNRKQLHYYHL